MSRKIIGITVGSTLPKPNLMQADPKKGDYVLGKETIPTKVSQLENDSKYIKETEMESVPMVLYEEQDIADEQKLQARKNIGATGAELAAEVLDTIPKAKNIQFLQAGNVVQMKTTLDDGYDEIVQITLDANGFPKTVEKDGAVINLTWEGF